MPFSQPCTTQECREAALAAFRAQKDGMTTLAEALPRPAQSPAKAGESPLGPDAAQRTTVADQASTAPSPVAAKKGGLQEGVVGTGTHESGNRVRLTVA